MRLILFFTLFASLVSPFAASAAPVWTVDTGKSSISFEYVESGKSKTGAFRTFTASIAFDPNLPEDASASFSVKTASIDLNDAMREGVLGTAPWFNSEDFPRADFSLTGLRFIKKGQYLAEGVLRIKTIERPVQLMISLSVIDETARAKGVLEIERRDFQLRDAIVESIVGIGDKVTIRFDLVATLDTE